MKKIVLIDGYSIINRAFYGVPLSLSVGGTPTNAIYGFLAILFKVLEEERPEYLAVAFDVREKTFRHHTYAAYKGTRKPMPDELQAQVPVLKQVLEAMHICRLEAPGYEADDIIGTLAAAGEKEGMQVVVVSGDRDLLQLATDRTLIRIPKTKGGKTEIENYYAPQVKETYQVSPRAFIDVKALMGDPSDNIPGLPGVGEKTAIRLISTYQSIENCFAHLEEITPPKARKAFEEHFDLAVLSKDLATIRQDVPLDFSMEQAAMENMFNEKSYEWMKKLNFKSFLSKFQEDAPAGKEGAARWVGGSELKALLSAEQSGNVSLFPAAEQDKLLAIGISFGEEIWVVDTEQTENLLMLQDDLPRHSVWQVIHLKPLLKWFPITPQKVMDASVGTYLLYPLKAHYEPEDISSDLLGKMQPSVQELFGKLPLSKAKEEKETLFLQYVEQGVNCAREAAPILEKRLQEEGMWELYQDIECPLIYCLFSMEQVGIRVDAKQLQDFSETLETHIRLLEKEIHQEAGEIFNIQSPKQLGEVLFERMGLPYGKKTKTGYSTAVDVLEKLKPNYPIVQKILTYRQLTKLKSTYAEGLQSYIREDGRIHGTFNQTIAATGRISSTEPNLQNIPIRMEMGREIRKAFLPREGWLFLDADYSQVELRILAHLSGDKNLIEAYRQAQDIHAITASQVFGVPLEEVTPLMRRNAKAVNFGIVYGISAFGLSEDLSITRKEAGAYIDKYFSTYPGVKIYLDELVEQAKTLGYVTTMFGRRRPIPEMKSANFMQRSFGERVAMNSPIQGTAADIMKIAAIRVDKALREEGVSAAIVLQVHDELLVEVSPQEADRVEALLKTHMRGAANLQVPLEVDVHRGKSWFETK